MSGAFSRVRAEIARNRRILPIAGTLAAGILLVILGWYGAAHTNIITEQIPYLISGGLLGLGLIILAGILAVQASIERDNAALRTEVARELAAARAAASPAVPSEQDETDPRATSARARTRAARPAAVVTNGHVYMLDGGRSFHVAGCPIVEGKPDVRSTPLEKARAAGYASCKLCGD